MPFRWIEESWWKKALQEENWNVQYSPEKKGR